MSYGTSNELISYLVLWGKSWEDLLAKKKMILYEYVHHYQEFFSTPKLK